MMKNVLKYFSILIILLTVFTLNSEAQNERKFVREGNSLFEQALSDTTKLDTTTFSLAETEYRKALDKRPDDLKWKFNLGDALYKQMKFEESAAGFGEIADKSTDKMEKARSYHNMGNSLLMQNKLDESIEAYKDALRNNPNDLDSKYNLVYAMNLKKKQEKQQQQNKDQNKDQDKNKDNQDQNKDQQNKDQKDKNKDQQNQQQKQDQNKQNQDQDQDQKQQQPQQQKISKENAERLLQALQNDEEKIQEKVKKAKAEQAKQRQTDKDW